MILIFKLGFILLTIVFMFLSLITHFSKDVILEDAQYITEKDIHIMSGAFLLLSIGFWSDFLYYGI
jgi:positive regulator of sigma E activity